MIIVSNTSPINNLAAIKQLEILHELYDQVVIPEAVNRELTEATSPVAGAAEVRTLNWIETRRVSNRKAVETLRIEVDEGEAEAIALALELNATLLIIDESLGRTVASRLGIPITGLLGVLIEAKNQGLILTVKPLLDDLIVKAGFWVAQPLYNRVLQTVGE